jgi:hypothetical protein
MAMVCPQCSTSYDQRLQCPSCGTRLLYRDQRRLRGPRSSLSFTRWQQTPLARILIGLLLAQGLFHGIRHLLMGVLLAAQGEEGLQQTLASPSGFLLVQSVRLLALLAGTLLAGSGQRYGVMLGAVVGVWNGALGFVLPGLTHAMTPVALYGMPLLQVVCGAAGGWMGSVLWKPLPAPGRPTDATRKRGTARRRLPLFAGPVAWVRVVSGVALAVAGALWAKFLFELMLDASGGKLSTSDAMEDRIVIWEIKAFALLLGGALAGATTSNGLKQGLCVGLIAGALLAGTQLRVPDQRLWLSSLTFVSTLIICLGGSWFGCQLFPPVVRFKRLRTFGPAS